MSRRFSKNPEIDRSLRHSVKDGVSFSVMSGGGESYLSAFAIFFKATTEQIGMLASLPPLLASFAQLFSAWLGRKIHARKKIILFGASLQGLMLVPLVLLPIIFPEHAITLLIISAVFYFVGANLSAPQWSSLMGDLVPERRRGRFFGMRTRLCSITSFTALITGGLILHYFDLNGYTLAGYLVIFSIAFIARFISVYHLAQMYDPPGNVAALESPFQPGFWRKLQGSPFVRFSLFFAAMQFGVAIASPFFIVYMLRDLHFSYIEYTGNLAMSVLIQFLALNRWGRISDAFGNRFILSVTGMIIPFLPVLWLVSTNYWYLLLIQALSGLAWAGFSLSAGNFVYDLVPSGKRATYMATHNVTAGFAVFLGASVGGYLGTHLPTHALIFDSEIHWLSVLYGVFIISTMVRLSVALTFIPRLKEVREVKPVSVSGIIFRVSRLHPISGIIYDIVGSKKRRPSEKPV